MRIQTSRTKKLKKGIALEGSRVALGFARSLTSYVRKIFLTKYAGKYRFSSVVFAFDALLIVFAISVSIGSIVFSMVAPKQFDGGLRIDSTVQEMYGSEETPIALTIQSTNGKHHENVRIRIQVPEWVEIVRTEPMRDQEGVMNFGTIEKNERVTAQILVRSRVEHSVMPMHFFVTQDDWTGFVRYVEGVTMHRIGPSRMTLESASEVVLSNSHTRTPFIVHNTATSRVPHVIFRIISSDGADVLIGNANSLALGAMEAHESRTVFVDMYNVVTSTIALRWQIQDGPQAATSGTSQIHVVQQNEKNTQQSVIEKNIPVISEARYYSKVGDQIGVGPVPPKIGYTTSYWAAFVLGPTENTLKNIVLTTELPAGVIATGNFASPVEATFLNQKNKIEWHIPSVPPIGSERVIFAYEIQFTPQASRIGESVTLIQQGVAYAETESGSFVSTKIPAVMTGIIQP